MTTYAESGVDIETGDSASKKAYTAAMKTFLSRKGMIGQPVKLEGGFAGALDFGEYYQVLGCDGVGTKIDIAIETNNFSGLGCDLLAMVADDAVCIGAETIAITNTIDTNRVNPKTVAEMMTSLAQACQEQKVVVPGGEIAELGNTLHGTIWNATALGIVEKQKYITGEKISPGNIILALREKGFRSNGFSLVRHICKNSNINYEDDFGNAQTWGQILLTPAQIYQNSVLTLLGRFGQKQEISMHGIIHITGGGIAGNLRRILRQNNLGADLPKIWEPCEAMLRLQEHGEVADEEAYKTWNMGNGMLLIVSPADAEKAIQLLQEKGVETKIAGEIIDEPKITHRNFGYVQKKNILEYRY